MNNRVKSAPEYMVWASMIARCENPNTSNYLYYGGRGITVCRRWRESYTAFLEDMGSRPSNAHSLDRFPDQAGNYEPGNCRWATRKEQCRNRRGNQLITIDGETRCISEWAEIYDISRHTLYTRLRRGWSPSELLSPRRERMSNGT